MASDEPPDARAELMTVSELDLPALVAAVADEPGQGWAVDANREDLIGSDHGPDRSAAFRSRSHRPQFKIKHRKGLLSRLRDARQVLGIITEDAEKFAAEIAELCQIPITDRQFGMFLSEVAPLSFRRPGHPHQGRQTPRPTS
ncbi:DUF932 domain-containing protein [Nocardia africana]